MVVGVSAPDPLAALGERGPWAVAEGNVVDVLRRLPESSVHCCVTSPPYFGLRAYKIAPVLWGGSPDCVHSWVDAAQRGESYSTETKRKWQHGESRETNPEAWTKEAASAGRACSLCGGWLGNLGSEPTIEMFVEHIVLVFREVRRVLRLDGTLWINMGDSMGVGTNLLDCLQARIKGGVVLTTSPCTLTVSAKGAGVLKADKTSPDGELTSLFGVQRVTIKQRNDDLGQILYRLHPVTDCRISGPATLTRINETDAEILCDSFDDLSVVVTEHDLKYESAFGVSVAALSRKDSKVAFAIHEPAEPVSKGVGDVESVGDSFALDSCAEGSVQVNAVDHSIPFRDAFSPRVGENRDLRVAAASEKKLSFVLGAGRLTFDGVSHVLISSSGGIIPYARIYTEANGDANENGAKQELGIPFRIRRALVRDGWVCRSTIIWHKLQPMPESVRDRPTKSHEYVFLMSKEPRYFFDQTAVREPHQEESIARAMRNRFGGKYRGTDPTEHGGLKRGRGHGPDGDPSTIVSPGGRNLRTVWHLPNEGFDGAHFAVYPQALVEPCVLAGTSERGACAECGAPWERVVVRTDEVDGSARGSRFDAGKTAARDGGSRTQPGERFLARPSGWQPTCECHGRFEEYPEPTPDEPNATVTVYVPTVPVDQHPTVPCVVFDPFTGSGTTGLVARRAGRRFVGAELSPEYAEMARRRIAGGTPLLDAAESAPVEAPAPKDGGQLALLAE